MLISYIFGPCLNANDARATIDRILAIEVTPLSIELTVRMPIEGAMRFGLSRSIYGELLDPDDVNLNIVPLNEDISPLISKETPLHYGFYCTNSSIWNITNVPY
jgi:hypothetical protein